MAASPRRGDAEADETVGKWQLLQANWAYQSRQFFTMSTLHGVRYIAEKGRPYHERLLWFVSTAAGLMAALVIVDSLWDKFQTSPTITGLDSDYHSWDVPFPAITLCPQEPGNATLIDDYVQGTWPDADERQRTYYTKFLFALTNISFLTLPKLLPYAEDTSLPQTDLRKLANSLFSQCHQFVQCAYKQSLAKFGRDCCGLVSPVFTEHGLCFSFNLNYSMSDWPWGETRQVAHFRESYIEETDTQWSFFFDSEDPVNNSIAVYISAHIDQPGEEVNPQHIWNKRVSKLMFVPKMTYTVDGARQLSPKQRGCVFSDEIKLRINSEYTFSSCARQCRMDLFAKLCGCLPIFYSLLPGQRYCELRELKCVIENLHKLRANNIRCTCPLGCEHTVYEMEKPHEAGGESGSEDVEQPGVEVGFLSWPLTRYKRDVLFGQVDLLVAIGTIAGLFLGFSLLSGVEIVYLFTLRAWCMLYTDRSHLEELAEEYARKQKEPVDLSLRPAFAKSEFVADVTPVSVSVSPVAGNAPDWHAGRPWWTRRQAKQAMQAKQAATAGLFPYTH